MSDELFRKQARKIWNRLSKADRKEVLLYMRVWSRSSGALFQLESGLKWDKLLPSTQDKLVGADFSMILGREVSPETE